MANKHDIRELLEATAFDNAGEKLGKVSEVYINDESGQPDFVEVQHGLFGMKSSLVPLRGHALEGDKLKLAFSKDKVEGAPKVDADAHLDKKEQDDLYRHYGLENASSTTEYHSDVNEHHNAAAGAGAGVAGAGVAGAGVADKADGKHAVSNDNELYGNRTEGTAHTETREARTEGKRDNVANDGTMIRSEEQLNVDKDRVSAGEARLRKYVVRETKNVEVPVEREEVRVERTPISAEEAAKLGDQKLGDQEASVTLHEDRVRVSKESVPVEKVNLNKETVQGTQKVSEDLAKERIETEGVETKGLKNDDLRK